MLNPGGVISISPDFRQHALIGRDAKLRVWAVGSSRVLHRWPLPEVPAALLPEPTWALDVETRTCCLVVRYGGAWLRPRAAGGSADRSEAGLVFVHVGSGECTVVHLPRQTSRVERGSLQLHVCPGRGHVLVHHDVGKQQALSVYTCQGMLVNSVQFKVALPDQLQCFWPASGAAVAVMEGQGLAHLWLLSTQTIRRVHPNCYWAAWNTPSSGGVLLFGAAGTASFKLSGSLAAQPGLPAFQHALHVVWGSRLVVLTSKLGPPGRFDERQLQIHDMHERGSSLQCILYDQERRLHFARVLQLSPDGELCATVSEGSQHHLVVVHLASGEVHVYSLNYTDLAGSEPVQLDVAFSPDCTAVLVYDKWSHRGQVFRF